jgi:tetratricopeptide (TPR) repeat protein
VAQENGNLSEAEEDYRQALEIERKVAPNSPEELNSLHGLGNIARAHGDLEGAQGHYRQALEINNKVAPEGFTQAEILASLASIEWHKGQPLAAEALFDRALSALEHQVTRLGGGRSLSSNFRASHAQTYSDYVALLMAQERPESALEVVERLHARSLLEMLAEARVEIRRGIDAELLERERLLQQTLNAKSDRRVQLLTSKHTDDQLAAVQKEIENIRAEYEQIEDRIRANSPGYSALTKPNPLSTKQIQQLLDKETLLLEYELGDERSYLFAVTPETLTGYELPKRTTIENLARRLHTLLSKPKGREITAENHERLLRTTSAALSQMILGSVAGQLGGKRLLIVSDGGLFYVPFAMLPTPGKTRAGTAPLLIKHEIVYAPSASVLAELRREAADRAQAPKAVAVLADPVFDNEDPRVKAIAGKSSYQASAGSNESGSLLNEHLTRSVADVGLAHLPRLAFSRREADAIMAVTPSGQGREA